ncbi:integrase, catalytic region, zinc finger, CCHC-type containing protein [Tanacetum coccineum]|uniref:Integrase, catalytic region, zinc finger, CCHC-type containing protein n=1 Tax=Tanacetum coccineum TaxID=301880 RepID=A0ABQ5CDG6_9ASTR
MNHQTSTIPQVAYHSPQAPTQLMTELPFVDSVFAVPVFSPGDDSISCLNKAMAFLTVIASSRGDKGKIILVLPIRVMLQVQGEILQVVRQELLNAITAKEKAMLVEAQEAGQILDEEQLTFLANPGIPASQAQKIIPHNAAFQTEDLDTFDSDCDDLSTAQAVLMANISNYGSNVISKAQQDSMILSVIEQMSEQMINHVNNWEKENKEQNNESITAELERYKERVKTFEQRLNIDLSSRKKMIDSQMDDMIKEKLALKEQIDSLEKNLSKQIKEKEFLFKTFTVFKNESKEKENKYMENEIDLEKKIKELDNIVYKVGQSAQTVHMLTKPQAFYDNTHKQALGYQNPFYLRKAQRIKPTLYDGAVISKTHVAMPVIDDEETLILEEESRSKMFEKAKDPEVIAKKISHKPIDYEKLNSLIEDFKTRFSPQQELSAEQAFWFHTFNPTIGSTYSPPVIVDVPSELPKVSLVNASLKKLKFNLTQFDSVVKERTTPSALEEGEWGFEHTKAVFNNEIISFLKSLKDIFNVFDKDLLNEITEVQIVFDQMEASVQQFLVDKKCLEIAKKEILLENDRILQKVMSQDVLITVMNSMSLNNDSVNVNMQKCELCEKCMNLDAELSKSKQAYNDLLKNHSQLEKHSRLQDKDTTISKLKDTIKSLKKNTKEKNVNHDKCDLEPINEELENSVAKLLSENERLCNEINHVKQVFKDQFDSIKQTRVRHKEQCDSLINKLNLKSVENEDLKAQIQDKVFVITSLKNDLRKSKGKEIVENVVHIPSATTIAPGMFKLDLVPLPPRLLQNREVHINYLRNTQEQANILQEIVEQAKAKQPLDSELDFACKYATRIQELLVYVQDTCPNAITPSPKKVAITPMNKVKKVRSEVNKKNKVEAQPRKVNKMNRVVKLVCDVDVKHSLSNANSEILCATCNKSKFDGVHDKCLLDLVQNGNNHTKSAKKHKKQNIWKPMGHVFTELGFKYKPTGRTFTIVGNSCPLTRITSTNVVPPKQTTSHSDDIQKPKIKVYGRKPKNVKNIGLSKIAKIVESKNANHLEPNQTWGSNATDIPSSSSLVMKGFPDCTLRQRLRAGYGTIGYLILTSGKARKPSHQPKAEDTNQEKLYLLHMDLCGPMRVASINGKRYILVIVDDYSRFAWVRFLKTKDEAPAAIIKCIKNIQVRLKATVWNIQTDNGTEFVNQILREWYENVGISHQTYVARTPQQNGVVKRRNRTLVEAARTMLIFSKALLFLWAEAINTACYTQNRPGLQGMTPATSSTRLGLNPISQLPCLPPKRDDWDLICTDIAKITKKRSKPDKHEHGNG